MKQTQTFGYILTDFVHSDVTYDTNSQYCSFRLIRNYKKRARLAN